MADSVDGDFGARSSTAVRTRDRARNAEPAAPQPPNLKNRFGDGDIGGAELFVSLVEVRTLEDDSGKTRKMLDMLAGASRSDGEGGRIGTLGERRGARNTDAVGTVREDWSTGDDLVAKQDKSAEPLCVLLAHFCDFP